MDLESYHGSWLAIYVSYKREVTVAKMLRQKGFEGYCPTSEVAKELHQGLRAQRAPLFPGYVFCRYDARVRSTIVSTPGVIRILRSEPRIDDRDMESVRLIERTKVRSMPCEYLLLGTRVRVRSGPLVGVEGILSRHKNKDRLVVSIDIIRNSIAVNIDANDVEAVGPFVLNTNAQELGIKTVLRGA